MKKYSQFYNVFESTVCLLSITSLNTCGRQLCLQVMFTIQVAVCKAIQKLETKLVLKFKKIKYYGRTAKDSSGLGKHLLSSKNFSADISVWEIFLA